MFSDPNNPPTLLQPLTQPVVDRGWPYQVLVPAFQCTGRQYQQQLTFCAGMSLCKRVGSSLVGGQAYRIFCFKERRDAAAFRVKYDGVFRFPQSKDPGFTMIPVIGVVR